MGNKTKKNLGCLTIIVLFFIIGGVISLLANVIDDTSTSTNDEVEPIIDATQFSRVASDELIRILGQPEKIEKWNYESINGEVYPAVTYCYNNMLYEFLLIDDAVVRFTCYFDGSNIKINEKKDLFNLFNIETGNSIITVANTGTAERYHSVGDGIGEYYVLYDMNSERTIDTVRITYNLKYFN